MSGHGERGNVVVIGAGPAGTATAIELARGGTAVTLVERRSFPRPKVCGGCLGPRALDCLRHLDVDPLATAGSGALDEVRVAAAGGHAALPLVEGAVIDRSALDLALLQRAVAAGVEVLTETRARILPGGDTEARLEIELRGPAATRVVAAAVAVDATGLPVAAANDPDARVGLGQTRDAEVGPGPGEVWMAAARAGYAGLVRFGDGRLNVAASVEASALHGTEPGTVVDSILVAAGLPTLQWDEGWSGTRRLRVAPREQLQHRVLSVGDAAGFWEPFTGEGIGWALEAGIAAAPTAARLASRWDSRVAGDWQLERQAWMRRVQARSRTVAGIVQRPLVARLAVGLLQRSPALGRWMIPTGTPQLSGGRATSVAGAA